MTIAFVFTDDWEVAGDGSGDVLETIVRPVWRLMELFERHGARYTVMAEVMHYLAMRKAGPRFRADCRLWENTLEALILRGHDVQLHIHPQWQMARHDGARWHVGDDWSLPRQPADVIDRMVREGKETLESLLRPHRPDYQCHCFRSGAWPVNPSQPLVDVLRRHGIDTDVSICAGVHCVDPRAPVDYRVLDEPFAPYWADPGDLRRRTDERSSDRFLEIPTQARRTDSRGHRAVLLDGLEARIARRRNAANAPRPSAGDAMGMPSAAPASGVRSRWLDRLRHLVAPQQEWVIFDLGLVGFRTLRWLTEGIVERARERLGSRGGVLPIVLENHSKNVVDPRAIERYLDWLVDTYRGSITFMTLSDAARRLHAEPQFPWSAPTQPDA